MKKYISILITFTLYVLVQAQPVDTAKFNVDYTLTLQHFEKINKSAEIVDTAKDKIQFDYYIMPQRIDLSFKPSTVAPAKLPADVMKRLYRNFLRVGFGYPISPLAQLNIHNFDNSKFSYGLNVNHFSLWGPNSIRGLEDFAYAPVSDTKLGVFFHHFLRNATFYNHLNYNHEVAHRFAFNRLLGYEDYFYTKDYRDSLKNNFHHLRAVTGVRSNQTADVKVVKYDVRFVYDLLATYPKDWEHHWGLQGFIGYDDRFLKVSGTQNYRMDIDFDYYQNRWCNAPNDVNLTRNTFKFEFKPTMTFEVNEYLLSLGVGIPIVNSTLYRKAMIPVYPIAEVQLGLIKGIMSLYGGVNGNTHWNSLQELIYENPYIKPGLDSLRFSRTQISVYGGLKGNLVKKLNYHFAAHYSYTKDMPLFMVDTLCYLKNQFDVIYTNANILNVSGNLTWQVVDHLFLNFDLNFWKYYKLSNADHAWYKPTWEGAFGGKYYHGDRYIFDLNFIMQFGKWGFFPLENNNYVVKQMRPTLNFDAGFEYLITPQFACFAQINNLASQYLSNYYDFKNLGLNFIVGVTYSFGDEPLKAAKRRRR